MTTDDFFFCCYGPCFTYPKEGGNEYFEGSRDINGGSRTNQWSGIFWPFMLNIQKLQSLYIEGAIVWGKKMYKYMNMGKYFWPGFVAFLLSSSC